MIGGMAAKAEEVGLESVWTFEHAMVPMAYDSRYPYHKTGKMPAKPETPFVDPLIALSWVAARTKTLRLGTGVNILPQTNPLLAAKQVASLDFLSGGRMMYGVGIGWLEEEYAAMGTPFPRRGARFDDYIVAMKKVWSGEVVEHEGEFVSWSGFKSYPVPVQKPHAPVIIGGASARALRRVALHGDGWFAPSGDPDELSALLAKLGEAAQAVDRDPASIEITAMWAFEHQPDLLARFEDLGVSRLVVPLAATSNPVALLDKLGDLISKRA